MAYVAPYIDGSGLHLPTYQEILDDMIASAKAIFGDDIYLENDSADYQLISIFASKQYDTLQAIQQAYNSRAPGTAIGSALDALVKLNGIARKGAGYSTCQVTLTGRPYTQILGGVVRDTAGTLWDLPNSVILSSAGEFTCTATCQIPGEVTVNIGDISEIVTPTYGWNTVTNISTVVIGQARETDAQLRQRQTKSVAMPSQTMLEGTLAAIAACRNVQRCAVYENDTNDSAVSESNPHGLPAHSITCVVEGGDDEEIATAILYHKGIGCYTNGDQEVPMISSSGFENVVRFYRPDYVNVHAVIKLKAYTGFISSTIDIVKKTIYDYLQGLTIGSNISISMLVSKAMTCNEDLNAPTFGVHEIKIGKTAGSLVAADIDIAYNEIPNGQLANINIEVV